MNSEASSVPVVRAAQLGEYQQMRQMLSSGCNVDERDDRGRTALHVAAAAGNTDIVQLLHDYGAQLNLADQDGYTALVHAAANGHLKVMTALLERRADVPCSVVEGIRLAKKNGHSEAVAFLTDLLTPARAPTEPSIRSTNSPAVGLIAAATVVVILISFLGRLAGCNDSSSSFVPSEAALVDSRGGGGWVLWDSIDAWLHDARGHFLILQDGDRVRISGPAVTRVMIDNKSYDVRPPMHPPYPVTVLSGKYEGRSGWVQADALGRKE